MRGSEVETPAVRRLLAGAAAALVVLVSGCTSPASPEPRATPSPALRLDASVAQFRFDEGTRNLKAGVTNNGERSIRVSSATISWDGFAFPTVPPPDPDAEPGQTVAFTIAYGAPRCDRPPVGKPTLVAVVDGRGVRLPLRVEDPQLLDRLHAKACAQQRLSSVADVSLAWGRTPVRVDGALQLPGTLLVRHRRATPVTVVDLGGSVLLDLRTRRDGLLPLTTTRTRAVPVLIGSANRCDPHALGQSSQTFLLSAYVRLAGRPTQRVILKPAPAEQARIQDVLDRSCGVS